MPRLRLADGDAEALAAGLLTTEAQIDTAFAFKGKVGEPLADAFARELEIVTLVDAVLNPVVDLGSRYHWLATSMHWAETISERKDRIFAATAHLVEAARSLRGWGAAELSLFTMVLWFEGLPARVGQTPAIERILRDASNYYVLGYWPVTEKKGLVRVEVQARVKGARVLARKLR